MDDPHTLFLREHVMPRLDNLEAQLRELREVTWPYVQAKRDVLGFCTIREQRKLLRWLDIDECRNLIRRKLYWLDIFDDNEMVENELQQILVDK
jgi:hypothetical protein